MRKALPLAIFLLTLFIPLMSAGQTTLMSDDLRVTVPFDFLINGHRMPAGDYALQLNHSNQFLRVRSGTKWHMNVPLHTIGENNLDGKTRLVFMEQDGVQILHQVWLAGDDHGHDLLHEAGFAEPQ